MSQKTTYFGLYIDIFEFGFSLHTEQMIIQAQDDPKTAQLRTADFIGEDYNGSGLTPNTLHNFVESTEDYKRVLAIIEPESLVHF